LPFQSDQAGKAASISSAASQAMPQRQIFLRA